MANAAQNLQQLVTRLEQSPGFYRAPAVKRKPDALVTTLPEVARAVVVPPPGGPSVPGWAVVAGLIALAAIVLKGAR